MRKFLVLTGSLLLLAALGGGLWWSWPILFPSVPAGWLSTLARADAALLQNRPDLARAALTPTPKALSVGGWLQWEKRVTQIAAVTQDWTWAAQVAAAAVGQFPGNPELVAVETWALLKARRPLEAANLAEKVLRGTSWESLALQARVEAEGLATADWSDLRQRLETPSGDSFQTYRRLASLEPEATLQKNALLAALGQGQLDQARELLGALTPEERDRPPFDRLQGLMAYDQGDWVRAAALLKSLARGRPDTLMTLADVYLHLGDPSQARIIYDQLLADQPDVVPPALGVNRATLALEEGDPALALRVLERILPGQTGADQAKLLTLEARFRLGETEAVRTSLDSLVAQGAESPLALDAELLKGRLFPEWNSVPRLWSLLHRHPASAPLAERLAWLLLVAQDYVGAHRVLDLHEAAIVKAGEERSWWSLELRALVLSSEDRLPEASEAFASVPVAWRDPTLYADWSLVLLVRAQQAAPSAKKPLLDEALERLTRALDQLPPGADTGALQRRSRWLTRKGELETSLLPFQNPAQRGTLRAAASEDFRQAVQLDPENLRASFLLRQAEATKQDPS